MAAGVPVESRTPGDLVRALEAVTAERDTLQRALNDLAQPSARQWIVAVDMWCDTAENVKHPGHLQARQLLGAMVATMDRARAVNAGLHLPGGPPGQAE